MMCASSPVFLSLRIFSFLVCHNGDGGLQWPFCRVSLAWPARAEKEARTRPLEGPDSRDGRCLSSRGSVGATSTLLSLRICNNGRQGFGKARHR